MNYEQIVILISRRENAVRQNPIKKLHFSFGFASVFHYLCAYKTINYIIPYE